MAIAESKGAVIAQGYKLPRELSVRDDVTLRLMDSDGSANFALIEAHRDYLVRHIPYFANLDQKRAEQYYQVRTPELIRTSQLAPYDIFQNGQLVGEACLQSRRRNFAEFGYWLAEDAQGQGIMTAAVGRLATFGFEEWGLDSIYLDIAVSNHASKAVARRIGAHYVDTMSASEMGIAYGAEELYELWETAKPTGAETYA
ncbi:MAG: hypothetical protein JWO41_75 [Candidatus Saccharibacteria bacterium]|nr:hypothetical protein [Candidatus Saccharibacteria bacterium]